MRDYVETQADNGGVHINSGIPNRAFYVTTLNLGGFAWEKAGQIGYLTLSSKLNASANFATAAAKTYETPAIYTAQAVWSKKPCAPAGPKSASTLMSGPPPIDENPRPSCARPVVGIFRSLFGPR